jgi:hypothetical protein
VLQNDNTLRWLAEDFPLAECLIVGPFDFTQKRMGLGGTKRLAISESNHIDYPFWESLERRSPLFNVSTTNIRSRPTSVTFSSS